MRKTSYFDLLHALQCGELRLVDLRSPCEFADGAMPYAVNVPLFTDGERSEVGTIYKQIGPLEATSLGLEFVAAKIEPLLNRLIELANSDKKIAIHCWRGGQRSSAIAMLLQSIGYHPILILGGYKKYRHEVLQRLDQLSKHELLILNGRTGSGKTKILRELQMEGIPCIDFEGIAKHRGSALGDFNIKSPQPTQQNFENNLANVYHKIKHAPLILAEIEQDLGIIRMPNDLRRRIYGSSMILLERSMEDRITHLQEEYTHNWSQEDDQKFLEKMELLKPHLQGPVFKKILEHMKNRSFRSVIAMLLEHRYDSCYDKGLRRHEPLIVKKINVSDNWEQAKQDISNIFKQRTAALNSPK
jgi:tRNA 2-selenouridine synthase